MSEFFDEFERTKREVCGPLREQVGWPGDFDCDNGKDWACGEKTWEYITALENALTAERHVGRQLYRGFRR